MLDTHKIAQRLMAAGMTASEADAIVDTTRDLSDAPTKADLVLLKADLYKALHEQTRWMLAVAAVMLGGVYFMFNDLKSDLKSDIRELRNEIQGLSTEIHTGTK